MGSLVCFFERTKKLSSRPSSIILIKKIGNETRLRMEWQMKVISKSFHKPSLDAGFSSKRPEMLIWVRIDRDI